MSTPLHKLDVSGDLIISGESIILIIKIFNNSINNNITLKQVIS